MHPGATIKMIRRIKFLEYISLHWMFTTKMLSVTMTAHVELVAGGTVKNNSIFFYEIPNSLA